MKLFFLGTCSGTEPMPGRHHVAWVLQLHEKLYWFDAGECCSHTAHVLGLNLQNIRAVFITTAIKTTSADSQPALGHP